MRISPHVSKAKMSLRGGSFFQFSNCVLFFKKLPPLKCILALPTWGQICTISMLQPFLSDFYQMEHPAGYSSLILLLRNKSYCKIFTKLTFSEVFMGPDCHIYTTDPFENAGVLQQPCHF